MEQEFNQTVRTFVANVRELVGDPEKWTQGALARDAQGRKVITEEGSACRFCILGAMYHVQHEMQMDHSITSFLLEKLTGTNVRPALAMMGINDAFFSHDHFISWFDQKVEQRVTCKLT